MRRSSIGRAAIVALSSLAAAAVMALFTERSSLPATLAWAAFFLTLQLPALFGRPRCTPWRAAE